ncbi:YceI family protein [Joostella sp. CR20]|uniref:YceI family protein n=1 Tax=Joostella sp. CR20 TaxID=2804312 RepID=UPI00313E3B31
MKKRILSISVIACLAVFTACKSDKKNETTTSEAEAATAVTAEAVKFKAIPAESTIEWVGAKPTGEHTGTIAIESGVVSLKDGKVESGNFLIDMNSITVTDLDGDQKANLEAHLKGTVEGKEDHFFNVKEHPTAYFEVTGVEQKEGKTYLQGNLAIKGNKKNISFPVTVSENGDTVTVSSESFTIDRTEWNVNYGSKSVFDDLGDKFVNDDIEIKVTVKAKKA